MAWPLVAGLRQELLGFGRVVGRRAARDRALVDEAGQRGQQAGRVGRLGDAAVHGLRDRRRVERVGQRLAEVDVAHRRDGVVRLEPHRVRRQHVRRRRVVGLEGVAGVAADGAHQLVDAGQEVVAPVDVAGGQLAELLVVGAVDDVHQVLELEAQAERAGAPPARLGLVRDLLGVVGVQRHRAGADRVRVRVGRDLARGELGPDVLRQDRGLPQVVRELGVTRRALERRP